MRLTLCPLVLALLGAVPASGVTAHLVKDINTTPVSGSSGPAGYVTVGGLAYFSADDSLTGRELWRTDGTEAGTFEVVDACPGACAGSPRSVATNGRSYFFLASSGSGEDLWVTGGSASSTVRLTQGLSFPAVTEGIWSAWVESQGLLYFAADDGAHGRELWRTDGTAAGTFQVTDIHPGPGGSAPGDLTAFNGRLYFRADDGQQGPSLWASDGTAAGTRLVSDPMPGWAKHGGPVYIRAVGRTLFFVAPVRRLGFELWKSDGTTRGTAPLTSVRFSPDAPFLDITSLGSRLLFLASDPARGQELWASDGTPAGTRPLTHLPRADAFFPRQDIYTKLFLPRAPLGNHLLFRADDGPHGIELWTTDGTPQGTRLLQDLCSGACNGALSDVAVTGGRAFFTGNDVAHGPGPWVTDGTPAGTRLIRDFCAGASSCIRFPYGWHTGGGKAFFASQNPEASFVPQLWTTDGTAAGTLRLTSSALMDGPAFQDFQGVFLHGALLFGVYEMRHGQEPWMSDGTPQGTHLVKDINLEDFGGSEPYDLHAAGGKVYFLAFEGSGYGMWVSDGTEAGTAPVLEGIAPPLSSIPPQILAAADVGGRLFFTSLLAPDSNERGDTALWRTDGTPAGTMRLTPEAVQVDPFNAIVAAGSQAFFIASDGVQGYGLWTSDGTPAGTRAVAGPGTASFDDDWHLTAFQGRAFFVVPLADGDGELWRSDGTAAGTVSVKALAGEQRDFVEHAGRLWFVLHPVDDSGSQIWSSDGTAAGTAPANFYTATTGSGVEQLVPAGSRLFFWVSSHTSSSLWVSDGFSAGGTREVADANVMIFFDDFDHSVTPAFSNGQLLFNNPDNGGSPWKSDGTAAGTGPLLDRDGHTILDPYYFRPFAGQIFFTARGKGALYQTDGTQAGTFKVLDLSSSFYDASVFELVSAGPRLFFRKWDRDHGSELWALEAE